MMEGESSALFTLGDDEDDEADDDIIDDAPFGSCLAESGLIMDAGNKSNGSEMLFGNTPLDLTSMDDKDNDTGGNDDVVGKASTNNQNQGKLNTVKNQNHNPIDSGNIAKPGKPGEYDRNSFDSMKSGMANIAINKYPQSQTPKAPSNFYRNHDQSEQTAPRISMNNGNLAPKNSGISGAVSSDYGQQNQTMPISSNFNPLGQYKTPSYSPSQPTNKIQSPMPSKTTYLSDNSNNYRSMQVTNPRFFTSSSLFNKAAGGYWMYQITTTFTDNSMVQVFRRFSHFVALDERLKKSHPGAIMPPIPDKRTSADDSKILPQTPQFAKVRATQLERYLTSLTKHPYASIAQPLLFFLTVQHLGSIWPEVSESTMTRLSAMGTKAVASFGEKTSMVVSAKEMYYEPDNLEDDAEMLALTNSEELRLKAVEKNVPNISHLIKSLLLEHSSLKLGLGMEASKCYNNLKSLDSDLTAPLNILSSSILRDGRSSKRLSLQLSATLNSFWIEYKVVENTRSAIADRKNSLHKLYRAKARADYCAAKLLREQTALLSAGKMVQLKKLEDDAKRSDDFVSICDEETQEIGKILKGEVARLNQIRRFEFLSSLEKMAVEFRNCCIERQKVWESAKKVMEKE